jgi:hypothetical protein
VPLGMLYHTEELVPLGVYPIPLGSPRKCAHKAARGAPRRRAKPVAEDEFRTCQAETSRQKKIWRLMTHWSEQDLAHLPTKRGAGCHTQYPLEEVHGRERWACMRSPSPDKRQEMQVRSFSAVRVLVQPKLWYCVCLVCERGARVPHPISVGSRRGGISVRPWINDRHIRGVTTAGN